MEQQRSNSNNSNRFTTRRALLALAGGLVLPGPTAASGLSPATAPAPLPSAHSIPLPVPLPAALVDLPPWTFPPRSGALTGILPELLEQLTRFSGVHFIPQRVPYPRLLAMLESGDTAIGFAFATPRLARIALPLAELTQEDVVIVCRAEAPLHSAADLRGKTLAMLRGSDYLDKITMDPNVRRHETASYALNLKMLLEGRVDAVVGLRTTLTYEIRNSGIAPGRLGQLVAFRTGALSAFLSRRYQDDTALLARLRDAGGQMMRHGAFDAAYRAAMLAR